MHVTVRGELGSLVNGGSQVQGAAGPLSAMGENEKFFFLQVCLEYSKFAKGKGGKEEDCSWGGERAQMEGDAE